MPQDRFDHPAAIAAALARAHLLHLRRLRLSVIGMFAEDADARELERQMTQLDLREQALRRFADDPYAADSLLRLFDVDDRALVLAAGRPDRDAAFAV